MNFKTYVPPCKNLNRIHSMALKKWCKFSIDFMHCWIEHSEINKRNAYPRNELLESISPIKLKPSTVKYQSPDFPWCTTRDVPRWWFFLTRRNGRIRNMALSDRSHFLTRQVPDLGLAECREISRQRKFLKITYFLQCSTYWYLCAMRTPHTALYLSFCEV